MNENKNPIGGGGEGGRGGEGAPGGKRAWMASLP